MRPLVGRDRLGCFFFVILATITAVVLATPAGARDGPARVALVIGNSAYRNVPVLANPAHDADDIASAFERLGFSVRRLTDASYDDMRKGLLEFSQRARGAEMAVLFFAGHGMEIGGENWLIPVDASLKTDLDIQQEAIALRSIMLMVSTASKLGLVVLDACRNNPFLAKMQRTVLSRSVERGLARIEPVANVLVAYAAKDGTTVDDGAGRNSAFTTALLKYLETPGLEINFLFRNVRDEVIAATRSEQQPFVYGSLSKEAIYLKAPPALPTPDQTAWELLKETTDDAALRRFLREYPNSALRRQAEARISALAAAQAAKPVPPGPDEVTWLLLKETTDEAALKRFVGQYPDSSLRKDAEGRIAALAAAQAANPVPFSPEDVAWNLVKDSKDPDQLRRFLDQFPKSANRSEAEQRMAALTVEPAKSPAEPVDSRDLARSLQLELKRVGCFDGAVNGEFGDSTRAALRNLARVAGLTLTIDPSPDTLKAVSGIDKRVCPPACPAGERVDGDHCVRIQCSAGQVLKKGACVAQAGPESQKRAAPAPPHRTSAPASKTTGKCFSFQGRQFCE